MDWEEGQAGGNINEGNKIQHLPTTSICYGSLIDVKAEFPSIESLDTKVQPWTSFHVFDVKQGENIDAYRLLDSSGTNLGLVDSYTSLRLNSIEALGGISFRAVISSPNFNKIPRKPTSKKTRIEITINIFGPEDIADNAGQALNKARGYLQHPLFLEGGIKYANPHYFYVDDAMTDLRHLIGPLPTNEKLRRISRAVENILDSLESAQIPTSLNYDIEATERNCLIGTKLKAHQIKGINFILSREDSEISDRADRQFLNLVDIDLA
ncbi:hypothetical protein TWF281_011055 [Arthrobotrys megalospora]